MCNVLKMLPGESPLNNIIEENNLVGPHNINRIVNTLKESFPVGVQPIGTVQSTPDNSNRQGGLQKVWAIGSSR